MYSIRALRVLFIRQQKYEHIQPNGPFDECLLVLDTVYNIYVFVFPLFISRSFEEKKNFYLFRNSHSSQSNGILYVYTVQCGVYITMWSSVDSDLIATHTVTVFGLQGNDWPLTTVLLNFALIRNRNRLRNRIKLNMLILVSGMLCVDD